MSEKTPPDPERGENPQEPENPGEPAQGGRKDPSNSTVENRSPASREERSGYTPAPKRRLRRVSGNARRLKAVMTKYLKISARDKPMYFWVFGYPLLFLLVLVVAFGGGGGTGSQYRVAVINEDGLPLPGQGPPDVVDAAGNYLEGLFYYNESGLDEVFTVVNISDYDEGVAQIRREELDAILVIPANFSELALGFTEGAPVVQVFTSPDPLKKGVIPSVVNSIVSQFVLNYNDLAAPRVETTTTVERSYSGLDYFMPGIVLAGVTVAIMNVAQMFCNDKKSGLLERLDTTPVPRSVQLFGGALAQIVFTSIQALILMLLLPVFGISVAPGANWPLAFFNAFLFGWFCIGVGLILAAVVKNADAAGGIAWVIILPMQFLGGLIAGLGDAAIQQAIPAFYAARAMRNILVVGATFAEVWADMLVSFVCGAVAMVVGVVIFQKKTKI